MINIAKWLNKHKVIFYILNLTWGIIGTFIGLIVMIILLPFARPKRYDTSLMVNLGKYWGGLSLGGFFFIRDKMSAESVSKHELGHTYQNAIFGPFMILLVTIPSSIRYWYRELVYYNRGKSPKTQYDDIWFERQATMIGNIIMEVKNND